MTIESQDHDRVTFSAEGYDIDNYPAFDIEFCLPQRPTRLAPVTDDTDPFALPAVPARVDLKALQLEREAAYVAWENHSKKQPRYIASFYGSYAAYREEHAEYFTELKRLSDIDDAMNDRCTEALQGSLAWTQAAKDAKVPAPAPRLMPEGRIIGRVKWYANGKGRIFSTSGEEFYFTTHGLHYQAMPLQSGDMVSFQRTQYSLDSMPRATMILVDGYTPAQTAYTAPQERVTAARETVKAQRATRKQHNAAKRENDRKNRESVANMPKRGAS